MERNSRKWVRVNQETVRWLWQNVPEEVAEAKWAPKSPSGEVASIRGCTGHDRGAIHTGQGAAHSVFPDKQGNHRKNECNLGNIAKLDNPSMGYRVGEGAEKCRAGSGQNLWLRWP